MQHGRSGRLDPVVARARRAVARALEDLVAQAGGSATGPARPGSRPGDAPAAHSADADAGAPASRPAAPLVLVGCSGGADSLALAAATLHLQRRGRVRVGAVVVDHQLQEASGEVARETVHTLRELGADPVLVERVSVPRGHHGPEMAARLARYSAFAAAVQRTGAAAVLLGHTRDDQAETVLLGLTRGSGTRSLSGMAQHHVLDGVTYVRPLLWLTRAETEQVCAAEGLQPWWDPTNSDTALTRSRIRHEVLPLLEEQLGPGVAGALARTASVLGADADYLDEQADLAFDAALVRPTGSRPVPGEESATTAEGASMLLEACSSGAADAAPGAPAERAASSSVVLDAAAVQGLPAALRRRVLARACVRAGGETPTFERLAALETFALGHGAAGPVQLAGKVTAWRHRRDAAHARGRLELRGGPGPSPQATVPAQNSPATQNNPGSAQ